MNLSTDNLTLTYHAAIDLQVHTHFSDGEWQPELLIDHFKNEDFGLAAITDHDRVDTLIELQQLAREKAFPILVATEMTCRWRGEMTDILCYGFDPESNYLRTMTEDVSKRQGENTQQVFHHAAKAGYEVADEVVQNILQKPSSSHLQAIYDAIKAVQPEGDETPTGKIMLAGGFKWQTHDVAAVVDAVHKSNGVCLIAHPGRDDGFICYDMDLLDEFRAEVPIDGIEVFYPAHSEEQKTQFYFYADKHNLLMSSGSDSHHERKLPNKYPAAFSQKLLERVGITLK